jgi:hypothetical protein
MKLPNIPYKAIIYLIVLLLGYMVGGYLLAAYAVNKFILVVNYLVTLRLSQTGTSGISLAIAWISMWIWGAVFVWATPFASGAINPQIVALLLLSCWTLAIGVILLLAFAHSKMYKLGFNKHKTIYGLTIIVWGAMTLGWYVYYWTSRT